MMNLLCNNCNQVCKKTKYSHFTILCHENKILCFYYNNYGFFKAKHNILEYLRNRQINLKNI